MSLEPASKDYIIVSANSIYGRQFEYAEQYDIETDCACADVDSNFETEFPIQTRQKKTTFKLNAGNSGFEVSPMYIQPIVDDEFWLAFDFFGKVGVVVLNRPAYLLFQHVTKNQSVEVCEKLFPNSKKAISALFEHGLLQMAGKRRRKLRNKNVTLTTWLHVTNACNLRCPYCYLHKTSDSMSLSNGRLSIDAIFRSAIRHGFAKVKIKYAGGEATLNMKLVLDLHEYASSLAREKNLELSGVILSNGVSINPEMAQAISQSGLRLMISLDGIGEVHDAQRPLINGHGSFKYVERTLAYLRTAGVTPTISITITRRNLTSLADTVRYVLERDLPFSLNFYRDNECAAAVSDLDYNDQEIIAGMRAALIVIENNLPAYSLLGSILDRARLDVLHDTPCGVGKSYMVIDQNGCIARCHAAIEQTISNVQAIDPLLDIRQDRINVQNPSVDEKEGCSECDWRYWCAGGCPLLTYRRNGRYDIKSPNCAVYQALFPAVLRLEGLRLLKQYTAGGLCERLKSLSA